MKTLTLFEKKSNPSYLYVALRNYGKIFKSQSSIFLLSDFQELLQWC